MRIAIEAHLDYAFEEPADVLLQLEAAALPDQRIVGEALTIWSDHAIRAVPGEDGVGQRCWARGERRLVAEYRAEVEITRAAADLARLPATAPRDLPGELTPYLLPSRFCESDQLEHYVARRFAGLSGGALATAIVAWVAAELTYDGLTTQPGGSAITTFATRRGVCRDYAHLVVALARAGAIPARCVAAYAPGVDPPDFHAVAELWLDGAWHLVDATGMARADEIAKVCAGRDATDIAFMTVFGRATLSRQAVRVTRLD